MPGWDDPQYELEEFDSSGGAPFVGYPSFAEFQEGATKGGTLLGPQLVMDIERSHPEETPAAKATIRWTWTAAGSKQRENWTIQGSKIVHAENKSLNSSTDLGKLFKSVKDHLPRIEGFDQLDAKSWTGLGKFMDNIQWGWLQEPKRMQNTEGKWVDDPEGKQKSTLLIVGFIGANNGHSTSFDPSTLGDKVNDVTALAGASSSYAEFVAKALAVKDTLGLDVFAKIGDSKIGPSVFEALKAF